MGDSCFFFCDIIDNRGGDMMKKLMIIVSLLMGLVACNDKKAEMFLYEEKGLGNVYSPVELEISETNSDGWDIHHYNEDKSIRLSLYLYGAKADFDMVVAQMRMQLKNASQVDEFEEDEFEIDGIVYIYLRGYDKDEDLAFANFYFLNSQGGTQVVSYLSDKENSDLFVAEFRKSFHFEEVDISSYEEEERTSVVSEVKRVGSEDFGYVDVPEMWMKFQDLVATDPLQYSDFMGMRIVTLLTHDPQGVSIEELMQYVQSRNRDDEYVVSFDMTIVEVNGYTVYRLSEYYDDERKGLTMMFFERNDGMHQYLSVEGEVWVLPYLEEMVLDSFSETDY